MKIEFLSHLIRSLLIRKCTMYIVEIKKDIDDELYFEVPAELLNKLGWTLETELEYDLTDKKQIIIKKKENKVGSDDTVNN